MRPALLLFLTLAAIGCAPPPTLPLTQIDAVKILVQVRGLVRVNRAELAAVGFKVDNSDLDRLTLVHHGASVPLELNPMGSDFAFAFFADPEQSIYSTYDVYWLTRGSSPGARMQTRDVGFASSDPARDSFPMAVKLEAPQLYLPEGVEGQHWFWQSLTAPATQTFTATIDPLAQGASTVVVALAGHTSGGHSVRISLNSQPLGEAHWTGRQRTSFITQTSALRVGENRLALSVPGPTEGIEVDLLSSITITYPRPFVMPSGQLEFSGSGNVELTNANGVNLYDISDSSIPVHLTGFSSSLESERAAIRFNGGGNERRYLSVSPDGYAAPLELRPVRANDLRSSEWQADYLIISAAEFINTLQPLVIYRTQQGLSVRVVDVEQIYDAFSDGVPDPRAVRSFVMYTREHWKAPAPRFVLLAGKASYDYLDYQHGPNKNHVPTFLLSTPHLGETASDNWFVAPDLNSSQPALAVGRIPANNPEELRIAINKLIAYESSKGDWKRRALFVADDQEPEFDSNSDGLIQALPKSLEAKKIYLSAFQGEREPARAELVRDWNQGALLVTYVGHGSIDTWATGPLFSSPDAVDLSNKDALPILLTPTCLDGFFYHPKTDSLAEALLFKEQGGIVAGLVPTGISLSSPQKVLVEALLEQLFARGAPTLGEAILRSKQSIHDDSEDMREVLDTFTLLGDPALKWDPPR